MALRRRRRHADAVDDYHYRWEARTVEHELWHGNALGIGVREGDSPVVEAEQAMEGFKEEYGEVLEDQEEYTEPVGYVGALWIVSIEKT